MGLLIKVLNLSKMKIMLYRFDRSITLKPGTLGKVMEIAPKMSECAKKILGDDMGKILNFSYVWAVDHSMR